MGAAAGERRLAAILAADVVGYSRLIGADEPGTLAKLASVRSSVIDPQMVSHGGRVFKTTGDGLLAEFSSGVRAVQCAIAIQQAMRAQEGIQLRIGLHSADVTVQADGDLLGDGVNVAARLEALADPGGICISGRVREDAAGKLSLEVEDLGEPELKNIARRHHVFRVRLGAPERPALPLPDKPSIAVLAFQNLSGDPEQECFADGMVEEIITALSRIRWLFVIARNSSFTYKGQAVDVKRVGRELGVRYVLEGSVRKAGSRVRITAQLIEAETSAHLWADRFDGSLDEVFDLQDNVAFGVAGVVESTLQAAEIRRAADRPTTDLTAYDLYLRARPNCLSWDRERVCSALALLEKAIEGDPKFGPALAFAATCHHHLTTIGGIGDPAEHRRAALVYVQRALQAAPGDPSTIAESAFMLGYFGEDIGLALAFVDRALELNPSFCRGWGASGWLRLWAGQLEVAIEQLQTAIRLTPLDPKAALNYGIGIARFFQGHLDEAITIMLTALQELPSHAGIYRYLASCYAHAGRLEDAQAIVRRLRDLTPDVIPNVVRWRRPEHRELFLSGLRQAMGEPEAGTLLPRARFG